MTFLILIDKYKWSTSANFQDLLEVWVVSQLIQQHCSGNRLLKLHFKCTEAKLIFLLLSFTIITQLMKTDFCSHRILCNAQFMMKRFHAELLMVSGDPKQKYLKTMRSPAGLDLLSDWTKPGFTEWNKQALHLKTIEFVNYS